MTEILNQALENLNYGMVWFLMLLESTVIPVPSELVVAPAAFNAADGAFNIWLIILFATIGADCGATINYIAGCVCSTKRKWSRQRNTLTTTVP